MELKGLLAQATVSDLAMAQTWYQAVLGREPDARPMEGLIEWHFTDQFGLQVWEEPARAGNSTVVLQLGELDDALEHLDQVGLAHDEVSSTPSARVVQLHDPDNNRVVLTGV